MTEISNPIDTFEIIYEEARKSKNVCGEHYIIVRDALDVRDDLLEALERILRAGDGDCTYGQASLSPAIESMMKTAIAKAKGGALCSQYRKLKINTYEGLFFCSFTRLRFY